MLQICTQMPIFSQKIVKNCVNCHPSSRQLNNVCMLNCIYIVHYEEGMLFKPFFCYLSFIWVSMLHAWTVNSANRLFKNARTHYSNHRFLHVSMSLSYYKQLVCWDLQHSWLATYLLHLIQITSGLALFLACPPSSLLPPELKSSSWNHNMLAILISIFD